MNLGNTIYSLRTEAGMSQTDLAEKLQVSRQSISKWETGASVPELEKLLALAELFQVSLDTLVTGKEPEEPQQKDAPPEASPAAVETPPAHTIGVFLLCFSAAAALLLVILLGVAGLLFVLPALVCGLLCLFSKKHPGLKCAWALFLMADAFAAWAMGIRPVQVLYSFQWTYEANYFRLFLAWVLFLLMAALVGGTAWVLRRGEWNEKRKKAALLTGVLFLLLCIPVPVSYDSLRPWWWAVSLGLQLLTWVRLGCLTECLVSLARFLYARKRRQAQI